MKYQGSKRRIAKYILPIILKDRKPEQWYIEPFCGGCNSLDKVTGKRIGIDENNYLIALLKEMQKDEFALPFIGEEKYKEIQNNKDRFPEWIVGYVGFNLSFGAKFFGGYRRDKAGIRNYENEAQQNLKAQQKDLQGVNFFCGSYDKFTYPKNSLIYADPPYAGTTKYTTNKFNHEAFWQWCRDKVAQGHRVFISEYNAPADFICVWQKEIVSSLTQDTGSKKGIERLFVHKSQYKEVQNER